MGTLDTDQIKTVLELTTSRIKEVTAALERNWTIQWICAGVGIALVYNIADLSTIICKYFGQESCTSRSVAPIFMVVVLYYFMKFGPLVSAFIEARQLLDCLLETYLGKNSDVRALKPIRESTSFFEGYYSSSEFAMWAPVRYAYFIVSALVIVCEQAAALFLLVRAYKANAWSVLVVGLAIVALLVLYGAFLQSKKKHAHTKKLVFACVAGNFIAFIFFWLTTT